MTDLQDFFLVRWTVRLAVGFSAARLLADAGDFGSLRIRRLLWTAGFALYLAHVAAAFHFVHGWSHADAWRETARQTNALVGWNSGSGLWANYAFTLVWLADAAAWWAIGDDYPRRYPRTQVALQALFAFLVFNATAVFGPPFWRPTVAAFGLVLAAACVRRVRCSGRP